VARLAPTEREHQQIQRRCAAATAKANACSRRLINTLATAFIAISFVLTAYTLHQEQQIQQLERTF
jgi:preprotein translocase subunit SecG